MYKVNFPVAFHTVDMAIVKNKEEVLLVQKPAEVTSGLWRFPGGFVDPADSCAEAAALREANEETGMSFGNFNFVYSQAARYIGSMKIDDPRYRESPHKIITSFYMLEWAKGMAGEGKDDIAKTKWFGIVDLLNMSVSEISKIINPIHTDLLQMFLTYIKTQNRI